MLETLQMIKQIESEMETAKSKPQSQPKIKRLKCVDHDLLDKFDLNNAHRKMNWKEKAKIMYRIKMRKIGTLSSFLVIFLNYNN